MNACETKLEDYTLKDIKRICEQTIDCRSCIFNRKEDGSGIPKCLFECLPENWRFEND